MIYGMNFNNTTIPTGFLRRFAARKPIWYADKALLCIEKNIPHVQNWTRYKPTGESGMARLAGVATSFEEAQAMLTQADNGCRLVWSVRRKTAGADVYGIYVY